MQKKISLSRLSLLGLVGFIATFSLRAQARASLDEIFEAIKNTGRHFDVGGTVCEEVERLQTAATFAAPRYSVVTGIAYGADLGVIGELDVIVFDQATAGAPAVRIAEVKCPENLPGGLKKAREQRSRFLNAVRESQRSGQQLLFTSTETGEEIASAKFNDVRDFRSIGPVGAKAAGYDEEIPYSLGEMMELRARLMECQARRRCKAPLKL